MILVILMEVIFLEWSEQLRSGVNAEGETVSVSNSLEVWLWMVRET